MATKTTLPQEYLDLQGEHYTSQNHPEIDFRIQVIPTGDVALHEISYEDFVLHTWLAQCEANMLHDVNK